MVAVLAGDVLVMGGNGVSDELYEGYRGRGGAISSVERYTCCSQWWGAMASLTCPLGDLVTAVVQV